MDRRSIGRSLAGASLVAAILAAPAAAQPQGSGVGGGGPSAGEESGSHSARGEGQGTTVRAGNPPAGAASTPASPGTAPSGGPGAPGAAPGESSEYGGEYGGGYGMGPGMMHGFGGGPGLAAIERLGLSDAQRARVNGILDAHRKKDWPIFGQIVDDRAKLRDLYSASQPDPGAIGAAYADLGKHQQEIAQDQVQAMNEIRLVLTPEQRAQFDRWRGATAGSGGGGASGAGGGGSGSPEPLAGAPAPRTPPLDTGPRTRRVTADGTTGPGRLPRPSPLLLGLGRGKWEPDERTFRPVRPLQLRGVRTAGALHRPLAPLCTEGGPGTGRVATPAWVGCAGRRGR